MTERRDRRSRLLTVGVAAAVAVAFADSSIVVLALPSLYSALHTSVVGVSWVITSYNLVVAVAAFALLAGIGPKGAGAAHVGGGGGPLPRFGVSQRAMCSSVMKMPWRSRCIRARRPPAAPRNIPMIAVITASSGGKLPSETFAVLPISPWTTSRPIP